MHKNVGATEAEMLELERLKPSRTCTPTPRFWQIFFVAAFRVVFL